MARGARIGLVILIAGGLGACNGTQSALHPAGTDAAALANLFWIMTLGAVVVWCVVMGIAIYAIIGRNRPRSEGFADRFILIGGVAFPTVTLGGVLVAALALLPAWTAAEPAGVRIHVQAEQFWWRFIYETPDGQVETANELHLPVDATAEFVLTSTDVIHSFWIPALGGKIDSIPGRTNLWRLTPTEAGVYRGVCAEFCGASHALMAFEVFVHDRSDYDAWLQAQAMPATAAGRGAEAFVRAGCGACHTVRGIVEAGSVGPDLTHLASRRSIAADTIALTRDSLEAWLVAPGHIKPDVRMPSFHTLAPDERDAIVAFLMELE